MHVGIEQTGILVAGKHPEQRAANELIDGFSDNTNTRLIGHQEAKINNLFIIFGVSNGLKRHDPTVGTIQNTIEQFGLFAVFG